MLAACRVTPVVSAPEDCTLETPLKEGVPGSPGHLLASPINPNGASELATLMRQMVEDLKTAQKDFNRRATLYPTHRRIRCSWPTSLSDRNATFDALAVQYLEQVKAFDSEKRQPEEAYQRVLNACTACHLQTCEGPLEVISGLKLPTSQ